MDLLEQLAGVWRRRFVVFGVALLVAAAVFFWRSSVPDEYEATTTMQVRVPVSEASDPSTQVDYYARTVIALATSRPIVETALLAADRTDDVGAAAAKVTAEQGAEPGFVDVSATGASPEAAAALSDEISAALSATITENQAEDLAAERAALRTALTDVARERADLPRNQQLEKAALQRESEALRSSLRTAASKAAWQVLIVEAAEAPNGPITPRPLRDALLTFLLAAIVVAEIVIVRRSWRGTLSLRDPARDAGETSGVASVAVGPTDGPAALAALLPRVGDASTVLVIHQGARPSAHSASLLAELLAGYDERILLVDAGTPAVHLEFGLSGSPGLTDLPEGHELPHAAHALRALLPTQSPVDRLDILPAGDGPRSANPGRLDHIVSAGGFDRIVVSASVSGLDELVPVLTRLRGPVVLDVEPNAMTRKQLRKQMSALTGLGVEVVAITVQSPGGPVVVRREQRQLRYGLRAQPHHDDARA